MPTFSKFISIAFSILCLLPESNAQNAVVDSGQLNVTGNLLFPPYQISDKGYLIVTKLEKQLNGNIYFFDTQSKLINTWYLNTFEISYIKYFPKHNKLVVITNGYVNTLNIIDLKSKDFFQFTLQPSKYHKTINLYKVIEHENDLRILTSYKDVNLHVLTYNFAKNILNETQPPLFAGYLVLEAYNYDNDQIQVKYIKSYKNKVSFYYGIYDFNTRKVKNSIDFLSKDTAKWVSSVHLTKLNENETFVYGEIREDKNYFALATKHFFCLLRNGKVQFYSEKPVPFRIPGNAYAGSSSLYSSNNVGSVGQASGTIRYAKTEVKMINGQYISTFYPFIPMINSSSATFSRLEFGQPANRTEYSTVTSSVESFVYKSYLLKYDYAIDAQGSNVQYKSYADSGIDVYDYMLWDKDPNLKSMLKEPIHEFNLPMGNTTLRIKSNATENTLKYYTLKLD